MNMVVVGICGLSTLFSPLETDACALLATNAIYLVHIRTKGSDNIVETRKKEFWMFGLAPGFP